MPRESRHERDLCIARESGALLGKLVRDAGLPPAVDPLREARVTAIREAAVLFQDLATVLAPAHRARIEDWLSRFAPTYRLDARDV